jgi:hypothetical protein
MTNHLQDTNFLRINNFYNFYDVDEILDDIYKSRMNEKADSGVQVVPEQQYRNNIQTAITSTATSTTENSIVEKLDKSIDTNPSSTIKEDEDRKKYANMFSDLRSCGEYHSHEELRDVLNSFTQPNTEAMPMKVESYPQEERDASAIINSSCSYNIPRKISQSDEIGSDVEIKQLQHLTELINWRHTYLNTTNKS